MYQYYYFEDMEDEDIYDAFVGDGDITNISY